MRQDPRFKDGCWEPAMLQLPVGEIQLFFSDEGIYTKTDEQNISMLRSFDNEAKNFGQVSTPFPEPEGFHALWNSLCVLKGDTVVALTSTNGYSRNRSAIWMIKGIVMKK